jgi:hypothetical protein
MGEILSNNKFIDFDRIVGNIVPEKVSAELGLPKILILRALAYGNQAEDVVYSPNGKRIPNLLSGKAAPFPKTLLKPKIIGLLLTSAVNKHAWTFKKLSELFSTLYGRHRDEIEEVFVELFEEGLIETDRGYMPSASSPNLVIMATPRVQCLWQQLEKSDVLLGIYRDDIVLTPRHQHVHVPTHELELLPRCSEIVKCCEDCLEIESKEAIQIIDRVGLSEYTSWFDESLLSEKLYQGTHNSILHFFSKRGVLTQTLANQMEDLKEKLANAKRTLFTTSFGHSAGI